jgi:hypothetical protein
MPKEHSSLSCYVLILLCKIQPRSIPTCSPNQTWFPKLRFLNLVSCALQQLPFPFIIIVMLAFIAWLLVDHCMNTTLNSLHMCNSPIACHPLSLMSIRHMCFKIKKHLLKQTFVIAKVWGTLKPLWPPPPLPRLFFINVCPSFSKILP